jgi:hypothetical protein
MIKEDHAALKQWLKKRYPLLFLSVNERTNHAFAIVDLPSVSPDPDQSFCGKITLSTPRQAENDFLRIADYQCTTLFDSHGWKKRLLEISRR